MSCSQIKKFQWTQDQNLEKKALLQCLIMLQILRKSTFICGNLAQVDEQSFSNYLRCWLKKLKQQSEHTLTVYVAKPCDHQDRFRRYLLCTSTKRNAKVKQNGNIDANRVMNENSSLSFIKFDFYLQNASLYAEGKQKKME